MYEHWIQPLGAFVAVAVLTPLCRRFAHSINMVARPRDDRWSRRTVALLGGIAIYLGCILLWLAIPELKLSHWLLFAGSTVLFVSGLLDDLVNVPPHVKLLLQLLAAVGFTSFGYVLPWTKIAYIDQGISIFWLIGITNAFNLLDNMDGLCAGIAGIASAFMAYFFWSYGQPVEMTIALVVAAACLGFLLYNFNPASIFMGDSGSQFLGFFLGALALLANSHRSRNLLAVVAVPLLVLIIPIVDTTLVTIVRLLNRRKISQGGQDHTSHRLVKLGMSERRAVLVLYGAAIASGAVAAFVRGWQVEYSVALLPFFAIAVILVGLYLSSVRVGYEIDDQGKTASDSRRFLVRLPHKRAIVLLIADAVLVAGCYFAAYVLRFDRFFLTGELERLFLQSLPVVVSINLIMLLLHRAYKDALRYISISAAVRYGRAVALGTAASILVMVYAFRFEGHSRSVFVIFGLLLFVSVLGVRYSFRFVREMLLGDSTDDVRREKRASLVYGAGAGGDLLLRAAAGSEDLALRPVGFIDDDDSKLGMRINGVPVLGSLEQVDELVERTAVAQVIVSSPLIPEARVERLRELLAGRPVEIKRLRLSLETTPLARKGEGEGAAQGERSNGPLMLDQRPVGE